MRDDSPFTHLDSLGSVRMVDVSEKEITHRIAEASCRVILEPQTVLRLADLPKGDAYSVARIAGIQAAKRTDEWIPLAHPLPIERIDVDVTAGPGGVTIRSRVSVHARTGAEMEALVACSAAAMALYDMVKSVDREAVITDLRLESKSGGRSGDYVRR